MQKQDIQETIESLSPNEREIIPYLKEGSLDEIAKKTSMNKAAVLRSLEFLSNKGIIKISLNKIKVIELGLNGLLYKQKGLPERRLISHIKEKRVLELEEAKKGSGLNDNEFKAALGALKKRAMININNKKVLLTENIKDLNKKTLEEQLIEQLPLEFDKLAPEQKFAVEKLKNRKEIIEINTKSEINFEITPLGEKIISSDFSSQKNMIEAVTPEIIKNKSWKGKKFRRYDIESPVPKIFGGKKHFVNQAIESGRKIWTEMGFKEMNGDFIQPGFWNFDALFTAQDHPVREIQDTFFIKNIKAKLPSDKKLVEEVKKSHENGVGGSKGWQYEWKEQEAEKPVLRTHTTCLSAQTLANLRNLKKQDKTGKFFAIGKAFRNETIDANHLFEFNQTEGIVIDQDANFKNLLGYLKEFLNKMGFKKVRFRPHFFPYTEPSVEADVYDEKSKKWIEVLGAGIFRPEVTIPLLGEWIPVLAWGMGFDRLIMQNYKIEDIRELYENNLTKLRDKKFW